METFEWTCHLMSRIVLGVQSGHRTGAVLETRNWVSVHEGGLVTEHEDRIYTMEAHWIKPPESAWEVKGASTELLRETLPEPLTL
jgi:hypothetical protein